MALTQAGFASHRRHLCPGDNEHVTVMSMQTRVPFVSDHQLGNQLIQKFDSCEGHISRLQGLSISLDTSQATPSILLDDSSLSDACSICMCTVLLLLLLLPEHPALSTGQDRVPEPHGSERYWLSPPPIPLPPLIPELAELSQGPTRSHPGALSASANKGVVQVLHVSPGHPVRQKKDPRWSALSPKACTLCLAPRSMPCIQSATSMPILNPNVCLVLRYCHLMIRLLQVPWQQISAGRRHFKADDRRIQCCLSSPCCSPA